MVNIQAEHARLTEIPSIMWKVAFILQKKKAGKYFGKNLQKKCFALGVLLFELVAEDLGILDYKFLLQMDVIVHKVPENSDLGRVIAKLADCPNGPNVVSDYKDIKPLASRQTMLKPLCKGIFLGDTHGRMLEVRTARSVTLCRGSSSSRITSAMRDAGLAFPVISKPLGSAFEDSASHDVYAAYSVEGLEHLLQHGDYLIEEYVDHGGVLQKMYYIGGHVVVQNRPSIHIDPATLPSRPSNEPLGRISCVASNPNQKVVELAQDHPDMPGYRRLARLIAERYRIPIFNADIVQPTKQPRAGSTLLHVIDLNYMPGVNKVSCYEDHLAATFARLCLKSRAAQPASVVGRIALSVRDALDCVLGPFAAKHQRL